MALGAFFVVAIVAVSMSCVVWPEKGVAVLAYHMIADDDDTYSVSAAEFEKQMQYLKENGYTAISLLEFAKAKKGKFTLPEKPIIITFDDGYANNYTTAMPIMEKYGMKGTMFMVANDIGKEDYFTVEQMKDWQAHHMEIGSHTANHVPLATLTSEQKKEEIVASKLLLEWKGLNTVFFMAYPFGSFDAESEQLLKENEYLGALTGKSGLNTADTNPYLLHRINVPHPKFGLNEFKLRLLKANVYKRLGL
jgi:peptidoglycan/xylan/chitin deacetylase (PgdA/CDA1 family)